jgi:uncharacterized membrane protein YwaF
MGDSEKLSSDSDEQSKLRAILRFASFAFPSVVTVLMLLICWRQHFSKRSIETAALAILLYGYFTVVMYRRSRGLSAAFFYATTGPDREQSLQDQTDIALLWGAGIIVAAIVYMLFESW